MSGGCISMALMFSYPRGGTTSGVGVVLSCLCWNLLRSLKSTTAKRSRNAPTVTTTIMMVVEVDREFDGEATVS